MGSGGFANPAVETAGYKMIDVLGSPLSAECPSLLLPTPTTHPVLNVVIDDEIQLLRRETVVRGEDGVDGVEDRLECL